MFRILAVCSSFFFSHWKYMFVDQYPSPIKFASYTILNLLYWYDSFKNTLPVRAYTLCRTFETYFARVFCRIHLACLTERLRYTPACTLRPGTKVPKNFLPHIWQVKRKPEQRNIMKTCSLRFPSCLSVYRKTQGNWESVWTIALASNFSINWYNKYQLKGYLASSRQNYLQSMEISLL